MICPFICCFALIIASLLILNKWLFAYLCLYYMHGTPGGLLLARVVAVTFCVTLAASLAARLGATPMAAFQTCLQVWLTSSLLSDGLAVAGQVIILQLSFFLLFNNNGFVYNMTWLFIINKKNYKKKFLNYFLRQFWLVHLLRKTSRRQQLLQTGYCR